MTYKYIVVGGNPFTGYTGTLTFTSLKVVGKANTKEEVASITTKEYGACGSLLLVIDTETGNPAEGIDFGA